MLEENLKDLGFQIIDKADRDGSKLNDIQVDELRLRHRYLKELIEKPDFFIKQLSSGGSGDLASDLDPYDK